MKKTFTDTESEFIENRIRDCRMLISRKIYPYLSDAIMSITLVASEKVPTMGVDKYWRCYYNPATVSSWSNGNICAVLIHEVCHLVRRHAKRALPPHELWNIATDMEINDSLIFIDKNTDVKLPDFLYLPSTYGLKDDEAAEDYYDYLIKNEVSYESKPQKKVGQKGSGKKQNNPNSKGGGNGSEDENSDGVPYGGSCSDGERREWEGEGTDNDAKSEDEGDFIIRKTASNIINSPPGNTPVSMKLWAQKVLEPKYDWRSKLRNLSNAVLNPIRGQLRTSFKFPSRRSGEFIWPGKYNPNPKVLVIVDTSGSMGGLLESCMAEVKGILRSIPSRNITFVSGDTTTSTKKKIRNVNQATLGGGGGTDMGAIIQENWEGNDLVIVITDGYTPWCEPIPKKVIACVLTDELVPSWIDEVRIKPDSEFRG